MIKYCIIQLDQIISIANESFNIASHFRNEFLAQQEANAIFLWRAKWYPCILLLIEVISFKKQKIWLIYLLKEILMLLHLNEQDTEPNWLIVLQLVFPVFRISCKKPKTQILTSIYYCLLWKKKLHNTEQRFLTRGSCMGSLVSPCTPWNCMEKVVYVCIFLGRESMSQKG